MIANTAFLAAVTTFLIIAWLAGELSYLSTYKTALFRLYGTQRGLATLLLSLNLCGVLLARPRRVPARHGAQVETSGSSAGYA